jgi:hypothetical protein
VNRNTNILTDSPRNMCTPTLGGTPDASLSPNTPVLPVSNAVFGADSGQGTQAPLGVSPVTSQMRNAAIREDANARAVFTTAARNLFPLSAHLGLPQASPQPSVAFPETPINGQTPGMFRTPGFGVREQSIMNSPVTANPFFGVAPSGPPSASLGSVPLAQPGFICQELTSKDEQLFESPVAEELLRIMEVIKGGTAFESDAVAKKLVEEIIVDVKRYIVQIMISAQQPTVDILMFGILEGYMESILRRLRVLMVRPVDSASQKALLPRLIAFLTKYVDVKGYGTIFPIEKGRKGKNYGSVYRGSFGNNQGNSSSFSPKKYDSQFKPQNGRGREDQSRRFPSRDNQYRDGQSSGSSSYRDHRDRYSREYKERPKSAPYGRRN